MVRNYSDLDYPELNQVKEAVRFLASECDGARTEDGHGFNKLDTRFGHSMAKLDTFTKAQMIATTKMCQTYRGQLERAGYKLPKTSDVSTVYEMIGNKPGEVKYFRGNKVAIYFPSVPDIEMRNKMKEIPGWQFEGNSRYKPWTFPQRYAQKVLDIVPVNYSVDDFVRRSAKRYAEDTEKEDDVKIISLSNNQVRVILFHAVWDMKEQQLVAAGIASNEKQSLQSIYASLCTNQKRLLTLNTPSPHPNGYLQNAKKGFFRAHRTLASANAKGYVECLEHPACGDPRLNDFDWFYILTTEKEDLTTKFRNRLNTAISWPILPGWEDYLMTNGEDVKLIRQLNMVGPSYKSAVAVMKNDAAWEALISAGLASKNISLN